jgi:hypothetical protein
LYYYFIRESYCDYFYLCHPEKFNDDEFSQFFKSAEVRASSEIEHDPDVAEVVEELKNDGFKDLHDMIAARIDV